MVYNRVIVFETAGITEQLPTLICTSKYSRRYAFFCLSYCHRISECRDCI